MLVGSCIVADTAHSRGYLQSLFHRGRSYNETHGYHPSRSGVRTRVRRSRRFRARRTHGYLQGVRIRLQTASRDNPDYPHDSNSAAHIAVDGLRRKAQNPARGSDDVFPDSDRACGRLSGNRLRHDGPYAFDGREQVEDILVSEISERASEFLLGIEDIHDLRDSGRGGVGMGGRARRARLLYTALTADVRLRRDVRHHYVGDNTESSLAIDTRNRQKMRYTLG